MVTIRLSKSKILDYINCPRMFYFKHCTTFGKEKQQTSEAMENGTMLHEIYEAYNTNRPKFQQYYQFIQGNKEFENNLFGFFSLLDYFGLKGDIDRAAYSEQRIYNEEWNLLGIIDAIYFVPKGTKTHVFVKRTKDELEAGAPEYVEDVLTEDEYWMIDYKTGKFHPNCHSDNMLELYIYEKLANQFINEVKGTTGVSYIKRIGFFYTKMPEVKFVVPVTNAERNRAMKKFYGIVEKINNDEFSEAKTKLCYWCSFKGICDQYYDDVVKKLNDHVLMAV